MSRLDKADVHNSQLSADTVDAAPTSSAGPLKKRRKVLSSPTSSVEEFSFPQTLYDLLSTQDQAVEWLVHGKSFRVLRWDVLCRVLVKQAPKLCHGVFSPSKESPSSERSRDNVEKLHEIYSSDSNEKEDKAVAKRDDDMSYYADDQWVEAFLNHCKSWGFEEVKCGVERGSFRHELFQRDSPSLLHKMARPHPLSLALTQTESSELEHFTNGSWKSPKVTSIYKPPRAANHPVHLHVPALSTGTTSSFTDAWTAPARFPTPPGSLSVPKKSSTKTIRFRDDQEPFLFNGGVVQVSPKPDELNGVKRGYHARGSFVSRRGRRPGRPGLISRHATR